MFVVMRFCIKSFLLIFNIFTIFLSSNPDAAQYLSFPSIRCTMHRERIKNQPSIPKTLALLYNVLGSSSVMHNIRKETVITPDGNTAIIFSTDHLLQTLSSSTEIYVDGTFSVSTTATSFCNITKVI